jgi:hypothetical protein
MDMFSGLLRILVFIGGLSFIGSGFQILTDPNCASVSWGGYRVVTTTCFANTAEGGIPAWFGGTISIIGGLLMLYYSIKGRRR